MRRTVLAAFLLTLGVRGWTDGVKGEDGGSTHVRQVPSRILEQNERRTNILHEKAPPETLLRLDTQTEQAVVREHPDSVTSSSPLPGNVVRLKESAPLKMRLPNDIELQAEKDVSDTPLVLKLAMAISVPRPAGPNEQALWRMLDGRQYGVLIEKLEYFRIAYPGWRPPAKLVTLAQEGLRRQQIEQAQAANDHSALILLAQKHPEAFGCDGLPAAWFLIQSYAMMGRELEADDLARRLLECPNEADRLATLYKSREWIPSGWERLIALEEYKPRSPEGEEKFRQLRYNFRMEQLLAAIDSGSNETALQLLPSLVPEIDRRRDAGAALLVGWIRYRAGQPGGAATAFANALQWDAAQYEARRGLALIALQEKRHDEALYHAESMPEEAAGRGELIRDVRVAQAQGAYEVGRHEEALRYLDGARENAPLPRFAELLEAWSRLQFGDIHASANGFARLYRDSPDMESAQGALLALTRAGREAELKALAHAGPLGSLVIRRDAANAFTGKRFLAAAFLDPHAYDGLGSAARAQAALIGASRSKGGAAGMSRLDLQSQPALEAAIPAGPTSELRLRIDRVLLNSGILPANMPVGNVPASGGMYSHAPTAHMQGWQPRLSWRDEREHVWEAQIGMTPIGGAVGAGWTGRVAYRDRSGTWHGAVYREPVRESILSYTGLRDPYQGGAWGRVLRSGVLGSGRLPLNDKWTVSLQATVEHLAGEQVMDNRRVGAEAGIGYSLKLAGMDYAVLGFSASVERYARNLSHFTIGHGGYFSPQRYWRLGPSLDFMTEENRRFILRGRVSAGRTGKHEEAAPFFPMTPDGRMYAPSNGTGSAYDMELSAVWRVNSHVQVGALFVKRHSPQYRDRAALGFVRIQFEPGTAVLSSDLPAGKELF